MMIKMAGMMTLCESKMLSSDVYQVIYDDCDIDIRGGS
jgi:hypothetical protein